MDLFSFVDKWFWSVLILVTILNAATFWSRARPQIHAHPELKEGYKKLIRGFAMWTNIPWLVMGIGCVFGGVPGSSFLRPRNGNPFVLAFFCSVFFLWILGTYWLVFQGGAQKLVDYRGLLNIKVASSRSVIMLWLLSLAGGIVAVILMFTLQMPAPLRGLP
jgi:hypothetical protein